MTKLADRVKETSTTTGTGTYSLAGAVLGYRAFSSAFVTTDVVFYCAEDGTNWEVGAGTLTTGTPWTLARTTILASSNAGAAVDWAAGTRNIFCTAPAGFLGGIPCNVLVVGGGGGGGRGEVSAGADGSGGGGAGGVIQGVFELPRGVSMATSVGAGGAGSGNTGVNGTSGGNSSLWNFVAYGGGGGGSEITGSDGGCGGGAGNGYSGTHYGGYGTHGQGFRGGDASVSSTSYRGGSGGGGAGGPGATRTSGVGADGGLATRTFYGTYVAGGGGCGHNSGTTYNAGADGGSGIVVVQYADTYPAATTTGTVTVTTSGGIRRYEFTTGTGSITL